MGFFNKFKPNEPRRAKIIGVRTGVQSKALMDENFGVYSFLVEYEDGTVWVEEEKYGTTRFNTLMQYVIYTE